MEISQLPKKLTNCFGQTPNSFILGLSLLIDLRTHLSSSLKMEFILKLEEIANKIGKLLIIFYFISFNTWKFFEIFL